MCFLSRLVLQPFCPGTYRHIPVRSHLNALIQSFHRIIIERVFRRLALCRPNQGFMCVGKASATEIWHRVGFTPNHIIQNPIAQILQQTPKTKNIMVAANNPQGAVIFEDTPAFFQPCLTQLIISSETVKLVPVIIYRINNRLIRPGQIARQLQIIWRISKDQINAFVRQISKPIHAIPAYDHIFFHLLHRLSAVVRLQEVTAESNKVNTL